MAKGCANVLCLVATAPANESVCFQHVCSRPIEWGVPDEPVVLVICLLSNADALIVLGERAIK